MKGVIPTLDNAKIFHPTPDIKAKKCPTPTFKFHPGTRHPPSKRRKKIQKYSNYTKSTLDIVILKSTPETVKYLTSTLDTDPTFKGPNYAGPHHVHVHSHVVAIFFPISL